MSNRLAVRIRTTVSSNTSGPRDQLLRAALLAHGFTMTAHAREESLATHRAGTKVENAAQDQKGHQMPALQPPPHEEYASNRLSTPVDRNSMIPAIEQQQSQLDANTASTRAQPKAALPETRRHQTEKPSSGSTLKSRLARILATTRQAWKNSRQRANAGIGQPSAAQVPPGRWSAFSHSIDGQDIKQWLRAQGFADHEFRIYMEFQRSWGCL